MALQTPKGFFHSYCDLRQGDPLYSLLFVIVMKTLSRMIYAFVNGGLFLSFSVGSRNVGTFNISHLLFVDDTLIFCEANPNHLRNLDCLFLCFETVSGFRINLVKSELVPVGNINNVEALASILDCRVSSLPMKYLGLLLGASFKAKFMWDGIIEKIGSLAEWKMIYVSMGDLDEKYFI